MISPQELVRLRELIKKGNADPKNMPNDELIEATRLLKKAGVTSFMLLGSLLAKSDDRSMRLLANILNSKLAGLKRKTGDR